jgi:1,4-alpha-glucan branching enzyme
MEVVMSLEKKYSKGKAVCKVTFCFPKEAAKTAQKVAVVGDFNNWNGGGLTLKRDKNGNFKGSIDLEVGKEYQFKYLIDGAAWENDWQADKYVMAGVGNAENSVVVV